MIDYHSNVKNKKQIYKPLNCLAEIILGQKSLNCRRFGICKMKPADEEAHLERSSFDCLATISKDEYGALIIDFLLDSMSDNVFNKYFKDGVFRFGEDYEVPVCIAQRLALEKPFIIPAGTWKLQGLKLCISINQEILQAA